MTGLLNPLDTVLACIQIKLVFNTSFKRVLTQPIRMGKQKKKKKGWVKVSVSKYPINCLDAILLQINCITKQ